MAHVPTSNEQATVVSDADQAILDELWIKRCQILNQAWVQVRYHKRRQRFFDLLDKLTKSVTVVLGASLLGQYFRDYLPWLAAAITSLGLLALVFGYSDRKQLHKELAEASAQLIAEIEAAPFAEIDAKCNAGWASAYARIVAKAPPPLKNLTLICEREQAIFEGYPDHVKSLGKLKILFAQFH